MDVRRRRVLRLEAFYCRSTCIDPKRVIKAIVAVMCQDVFSCSSSLICLTRGDKNYKMPVLNDLNMSVEDLQPKQSFILSM